MIFIKIVQSYFIFQEEPLKFFRVSNSVPNFFCYPSNYAPKSNFRQTVANLLTSISKNLNKNILSISRHRLDDSR